MDLKHFIFNILQENCYLLSTPSACVLVDPGFRTTHELEQIIEVLDGRKPNAILLTHGHFDHVMGLKALQQMWPDVPVYMGAADSEILEEIPSFSAFFGVKNLDCSFKWIPVYDGESFCFGGKCQLGQSVTSARQGLGSEGERSEEKGSGEQGSICFKAIATPGHTPGGICWYCESADLVFSGDTLFADTIGRTDLPHGDYDSLIRSIMEKLLLLPGSTDVFPGHGAATTIEKERTSNPFLEPFNEPEQAFDGSLDSDLTPIELHPN